MKLNHKGYLTVEVILASVVAITIAIFLMEITIKLVNVTDDAYVDTELLTDKALITKNIKENLESDIKKFGGIREIESYTLNEEKGYVIYFCNSGSQDDDRNIYISNNVIEYTTNIYHGAQDETKFYSKVINKNLNIESAKIESIGNLSGSGYILFKITADSKFSKENFEANIIVYNNKTC